MWLTRVSILRPVAISMLMLSLVVLGYTSMRQMPVDLYPDIDFPLVTVTTVYAGAAPEEIETAVTKPLEDAVSGVPGLKSLTSQSQEGVSSLMLEFHIGTDLDVAASDVREKIDAAVGQLPDDVKKPVIMKLDVAALPVLSFGISSKRSGAEIRELADNVISDRLRKVPGVASVAAAGGDIREILVAVDKDRLRAYDMSIDTINRALAAENLNVPAGRIEEGRRDYSIRLIGEYGSLDDIARTRVVSAYGEAITLADIATVSDTVAVRSVYTRLDREDSVAVTVQKQSDANTVEVAEGVKEELDRVKADLPPDVDFVVSFDQSEFILDAIHDVQTSIFLAIVLVTAVIFLFLHSGRSTFIVALAIPTSLMATFTPIRFAGFTINFMTLLALSLVVGILVDDSIVVLENIYRHLVRLKKPPRQAALDGRTEIGLAAITITSVDVVVFVPIAFMGGIVGQFFQHFGITVATATLFSLLVSFTLTPMLCARWLERPKEDEQTGGPADDQAGPARRGLAARAFGAFDRFYDGLDNRYRGVLAWALRRRWQVIVIGGLSMVLMLGVAAGLKFEFFPRVDQNQFQVSVEMPAGTSLEATNQVASDLESVLFTNDQFRKVVKSVFTSVGASASGLISETGRSSTYANLMVVLIDKTERTLSDVEIMAKIGEYAKTIPGATVKTAASREGGGQSPIAIELSGADSDRLLAAAEQVKQVIQRTEGTKDADISWRVGKPEIQATVDRIRASQYGLSAGQIASALRTSLAGSTDTKYREAGEEYDIRVRLAGSVPTRARERHPEIWRDSSQPEIDVGKVGDIVVAAGQFGPIRLADVADLKSAVGPTKIDRKNGQRIISVTADVKPGYATGNVTAAVRTVLREVDLGGVRTFYAGEEEMRQESFGYLSGALILAIVLVFILMAALFESLLSPLVIMLSLPMAMVGAILALRMADKALSIVSMIGIIMLVGLVTKNAILLVDYANTLRARRRQDRRERVARGELSEPTDKMWDMLEKSDRHHAILEAGPTRLRPILMTTLSMIAALMPTAVEWGRGTEIRSPMAICVIGGLIVSTLLTLVMIPVIYTIFDDIGGAIARFRQRVFGTPREQW